jgi:hypothetical protein
MGYFMPDKDPNDKDFIDWRRKYYIDNVKTEDDACRIWEGYLMKLNRVGKKTSPAVLNKLFPTHFMIKQMDIGADEQRSSDVTNHVIGWAKQGKQTYIARGNLNPISISEHAVLRYWQRARTRPNLMAWFQTPLSYSVCEETQKLQTPGEALALPEGLLLGEYVAPKNAWNVITLGDKIEHHIQRVGFRVKTFLATEQLNLEQKDLHQYLLNLYKG